MEVRLSTLFFSILISFSFFSLYVSNALKEMEVDEEESLSSIDFTSINSRLDENIPSSINANLVMTSKSSALLEKKEKLLACLETQKQEVIQSSLAYKLQTKKDFIVQIWEDKENKRRQQTLARLISDWLEMLPQCNYL